MYRVGYAQRLPFGSTWHKCVALLPPSQDVFVVRCSLLTCAGLEVPAPPGNVFVTPLLTARVLPGLSTPLLFLPDLGCLMPNLADQSSFPGFQAPSSPPVQNWCPKWQSQTRFFPTLPHANGVTLTNPYIEPCTLLFLTSAACAAHYCHSCYLTWWPRFPLPQITQRRVSIVKIFPIPTP